MRIISDRVILRKMSMVLIVLGVLIIIFMFAKFSPDAQRIRVMKNRYKGLQGQAHLLVEVDMPRTQGEMSLAADVETLWDVFRGTHKILLKRIPIVAERGGILNSLCEIAKSSGLEILSMKSSEMDVREGFSTIQVFVEVRCQFGRLGEFFKSVEGMERLVRVDRYDIRADESSSGLVVASLEISGYIRPGN